jgi:hypothetical protein
MGLMHVEVCCDCGIEFHVPSAFHRACFSNSRKTFYCPNGHGQSYTQTEADILRRERDRLKQDAARMDDELRAARAEAEAQKRQATAFKGVATRIKNRVKNGVCPCCNRTFADLARHVKSQHPDFDNVIALGVSK